MPLLPFFTVLANMRSYILISNKCSVLRRQCSDTNQNIKRLVCCQQIVKSNVSNVSPSSERNISVSLYSKRLLYRLCYPYWQYTNLFIFRVCILISMCFGFNCTCRSILSIQLIAARPYTVTDNFLALLSFSLSSVFLVSGPK